MILTVSIKPMRLKRYWPASQALSPSAGVADLFFHWLIFTNTAANPAAQEASCGVLRIQKSSSQGTMRSNQASDRTWLQL